MAGLSSEAGEELLRGHGDDEAPFLKKLVNGLRIPPVAVDSAVPDPADLGEGGQDVVHNHVVKDHIDVQSKRDELEDQGQARELLMVDADGLDELDDKDVVHGQAQHEGEPPDHQVLHIYLQGRVVLLHELVVDWDWADQERQSFGQAVFTLVVVVQCFLFIMPVPVSTRLGCVSDETDRFDAQAPAEHDDKNPVGEEHLEVMDNQDTAAHVGDGYQTENNPNW